MADDGDRVETNAESTVAERTVAERRRDSTSTSPPTLRPDRVAPAASRSSACGSSPARSASSRRRPSSAPSACCRCPPTRSPVPTVTVTPVPSDQVRVCPGALLRLGDEIGPECRHPLVARHPVGDAPASAPSWRVSRSPSATPAPEAARARRTSSRIAACRRVRPWPGRSRRQVDAQDYTGFAAAACAEPSGSIWLVGGSTAVGRTTLLTLANPSPVDATVGSHHPESETARSSAPGMSGIEVQAGAQRVISLAGFAPDVASPVVHVDARGGQVVASLQQSIVRGLDAGGVDLVDAGADPATHLVIPGVRILRRGRRQQGPGAVGLG